MALRKSILVLTVLSITGILFFASVSARRTNHSLDLTTGLPEYGQIPTFTLTNSQNEAFRTEGLEGKVWVADFVFTTCGGPCPRMTESMAALHRDFADRPDVSFVSISVNPEVDTPEVLAAYAKAYGADTSRWQFLTGDVDAIHELAVKGFMLGSTDDPIIHSDRFVLVDRMGSIRGYYVGTDPAEIEKLTQDIEMIRIGQKAK